MKIRNLLLCLALLFSGIAQADQVQTYKQEFAQLKESPDLKNLFNKDIYHYPHNIERHIQNYAAIPNKWHRLACCIFLGQDVVVATEKNMPHLFAFVDSLAKKADISVPYIFISINEGTLNAMAAKLFRGIGGLIIDQKALNELNDKQLEAVLAHEMGHIKYDHTNKMIAVMLPTFFASLYLSHKTMSFIKTKLPDNKIFNWGYWLAGMGRYIGFHEYSLGLLSAGITAYLTKSFVFGKTMEQQADTFAHEMGYANELIEVMKIFEQKNQELDSQFNAVNDKLATEKENLTAENFMELQQEIISSKLIVIFLRWLQEKTPLLPHPSPADRIAAAQAYLDAHAQDQAIEKA